jgi:hypothetical protein
MKMTWRSNERRGNPLQRTTPPSPMTLSPPTRKGQRRWRHLAPSKKFSNPEPRMTIPLGIGQDKPRGFPESLTTLPVPHAYPSMMEDRESMLRQQRLAIVREANREAVVSRRSRQYDVGTSSKVNLGRYYVPSLLARKQAERVTRMFRHKVKQKDRRSYTMLMRLSNLLTGIVFETSYVFYGTLDYVSKIPGYARVWRKPNISATCLLINQVLRCKTNAPLREIVQVINSLW